MIDKLAKGYNAVAKEHNKLQDKAYNKSTTKAADAMANGIAQWLLNFVDDKQGSLKKAASAEIKQKPSKLPLINIDAVDPRLAGNMKEQGKQNNGPEMGV